MPRSLIALALVATALAVSGCGGGDSSEKKAASSTPETGATTDARPPGKSRQPKEAEAARRERADDEQQKRELEQLEEEDREFDRSFEETSFEGLVGKLPIRKPPLYVEQYITGDGHKLYTAVARKRFCKMSAAERKRAVASFFRTAERTFRNANVKDFEQVVTPLAEKIDKLPALATARSGSVSLTSRGRTC